MTDRKRMTASQAAHKLEDVLKGRLLPATPVEPVSAIRYDKDPTPSSTETRFPFPVDTVEADGARGVETMAGADTWIELWATWLAWALDRPLGNAHGAWLLMTLQDDQALNPLPDDPDEDEDTEAHELLVDLFETETSDHLGGLYMGLPHGGEGQGQYFTPHDLSAVTAALNLGDMSEWKDSEKILTVHEPAVGSGGMVIALAEHAKKQGINYQQRVLVDCADLDITAVRMAYIQLTLLGVPAIVRHMNTLSLEEWSAWPTIFYGPVARKYRLQKAEEKALETLA